MSKLRIISWNIAKNRRIEEKMNYLLQVIKETSNVTILALQEVMEEGRDFIKKQNVFSEQLYSLDFRPPGIFDTTNRKLGCFIGVIGNASIKSGGIIERAPFPERTLFTEITLKDFSFKMLCFHSLTGVDYKKAKTAQFIAIAEHLQMDKDEPTICCFDANEPEIDHYDIEKIKFFSQKKDQGRGAALILGSNPIHSMRDTYRIWLENNESEFIKIKNMQDNVSDEKQLKYTPLTTSHIVSKKYNRRYDFIFSSGEFKVINTEYRLGDSLKAGSDHSMVVTDFMY